MIALAVERRRASDRVPGLAGLLAERARRAPDSVFLRWNEERLGYAEADLLIRRVAAALRERDGAAGGGGRVAVYSANCPAAILVWLAAQAAGLVPVTLNREQRGELLADVVRRSAPSVLVADETGAALLREAGVEGCPEPLVIGGEGVRDLGVLLDPSVAPLDAPVRPARGDPATIMFSSGTTGPSKGVIIPHGMFDAGSRRLCEAWSITDEDVFHCWVPWFHVAAQQDVLAIAIRAGACVALFEGFSLSKFWQQVRESGATIFGGFVTVLEMLYSRAPSADDRAHRLRFGIAGHLPARLAQRFEQRFGVRMLDAYGLSEAEPVTIPSLRTPPPVGSVGRANPDFELRVQRPDGRPCEPDEEGQIVFRPRGEHVMMREYLDDPGRTAAAWRDGWFLTGDLGRMDAEGYLFFRDRMSEFIRVGGENVSPQEVESVLMSHPEVAEAAVVGVAAALGEHEVAALVVPRRPIDEAEFRAWCAARMAKFMVPSTVRFVARIPRTPTSKVQRAALDELLRADPDQKE